MSLEHPLVGADQVPRRLAEDGAPAILHSAPEVFVTPCPAPRRIVRRADDVREIEKRVTHRKAAVPDRLHPPRIDAGEKVRMGDKMRVERPLIDDLATRDVNQDRVLLHQVQFARPDQSLGIGLILAGFFGAICVAWAGGRMFARWPGPDSRKETDGWRIRCNDVRTSSVAQPVNAVQSSSDETQIPIAEPINTGAERCVEQRISVSDDS